MSYNVKWSDQTNLDIQKIIELERKWNIQFPKKYVDIVLNHDGSVPYVMNEQGSGMLEL